MSNKLMHRVRSLVERGERIGENDTRDLFEVKDLVAIAKLARIPRERRFGRDAFYHAVHVADYRGEHPEFFLSELQTEAPADAVELAIRCSYAPGETLEIWRERLREFSRGSRRAVALLSAGSIARLAAAEGISHEALIGALLERGPVGITGEDAEIFDAELRASHAPGAISPSQWLAVHRAAHRLGLKTRASMAYGTVDHPAACAAHLHAIRGLQDETGGFIAFVPMAMHNHGVDAFYLAAPTAAQSMRTTAIARAVLDNVPHIVAVPSLVTLEIAVVILSYGADTLDATILTEDVHSSELRALGGSLGALPIIGESAPVSTPRIDLAKMRSRIEEARWNPVAVDVSFTAVAPVVA